jgi:hypothetical protein
MILLRLAILLVVVGGSYGLRRSSVIAQEVTVRIDVDQKSYIGKPLAWDGQTMALLRRDGRWINIPVSHQDEVEQIADDFRPFSFESMRTQLQQEFGIKYQVSTTRNFIVVHPPGDPQVWATPFEVLYQRFRNYFTSRGMSLEKPEFPMVAVVLRTRNEFDKFLRKYHFYDSLIMGYYSPRSNRIITFDPTGGRSARRDWAFNATMIHEAAHQSAYNVGIHTRFGIVPLWISEGLALMFEADGVTNTLTYTDQKDRINRDRLVVLKKYYADSRAQGKMKAMITGDALFDDDPSLAYALAWGMTFFLAESYPRQYFKFLAADGNREEFTDFDRSQRLTAFQRAFGTDLDDLEKRLERFVDKLEP